MLPISTCCSSSISSRVMKRRFKVGIRYSGVSKGSCISSARYLRKCSMRSSFIGVAQRDELREKVPFAARVRARVALVQRRFVIWMTVALLALSVASMMIDREML